MRLLEYLGVSFGMWKTHLIGPTASFHFCDNYTLVTIFFSYSMAKSWMSAITRNHEIKWKG